MRNTRPTMSITGGPTVGVSKAVLTMLWSRFTATGISMHSASASTVWAITARCREEKIAYAVEVTKDENNRIVGVCVRNLEKEPDWQMLPGWKTEVLEIWRQQ